MKRHSFSHQIRHVGAGTQRGLTIIELMIAIVIGLLIIVAMTTLFVGSSAARREVESSADVIENGRYAVDLLTRELSQTGFYGSLVSVTGGTANACSTALADWQGSLAIHVLGWNQSDGNPACLSERKAGTDAIFVQRASTCAVGDTGCNGLISDQAYLQVSECGSEYSTDPFRVDKWDATTFNLRTKTCAVGPPTPQLRKIIRRFFFIDGNNVLRSQDMTLAGAAPSEALVENIEQLQIEYGVDSNLDGSPDLFTSTPGGTDWPNVIGVRLWLLARSTAPSRIASPAMTFAMGDLPAAAAPTDKLMRRVYSTYIPFTSVKMRREK